MVSGKDGDHTGTRRMVTGQVTMAVLADLGQMQQWQAVLDSAGEGIWGLDLQGRCTFVNRMAVSTFGFASDEELVGRNMHDLVHHHYPDGRPFPSSECRIYDVFRNKGALRQVTDTMFRKCASSFVAELPPHPATRNGKLPLLGA